jgi:hypothetical protein
MTLYYIDQGSGLWNDPDNWFQNEAGTIPNYSVPSPLDDCVINAGNTVDELIGTYSSVVNNGTIIQNFDAIIINNGTINYNGSTIEANNGTIDANDGMVDTNDGTITVNNNSGTVIFNNETIVNNSGNIVQNGGIVTVNNNIITYNFYIVNTNSNVGTVDSNYGTIDNNNGTVNYNYSEGTVTNNCGTIITNDGFAGPCPTPSYTNPNILKADLHASYETGLGTWQNYRATVTGLFAANSGTNRSDYRDHLIREFNRKISVLNQPTGLFIRPFDDGFRFTGVSIQ